MIHLLVLHLCLYSLWRKLSDELSQGVQPRELHETSHTQSNCGKLGHCWRSWGLATTVFRKFRKFGVQPYLKPKILIPSVFSILIWGPSQEERLEVNFFKRIISQAMLLGCLREI